MFAKRLDPRPLSVAIGALVVLACGGGGSDSVHYVLDKNFHLNVFNNGPAAVTFRIDHLDYPVAAGNHTNGTWRVRLEKQTSTDIIFVEVRSGATTLKSNSYTINYATANSKDTLDINWDGTDITYNPE